MNTPLPINGRIVIATLGTGFGGDDPSWPEMDLRSGTDRVPLEVAETYSEGTVVVFIPTRELRPTTKYELCSSADDKPIRADVGAREGAALAWTTSATANHVAPRWRSAPTVERVEKVRQPCGVQVRVDLAAGIDGAESVQVFTEITAIGMAMPIGRGRPMRQLVEPRSGVLLIGHSYCGWGFDLEAERRYAVKLTAFDAAGNRSPTRRIEITAPACRL